jgi:CheY-like chemotaxis protein
MPVMDGWEFLDTLQQYSLLNKIPIAILTSSIDPSDKKKSTNYTNVVEFISKPLSQSKLEGLIQKISPSNLF